MYNADAAADEQRAGQLMRRSSTVSEELVPLFKNLRLVVRDKAHASRRWLVELLVSKMFPQIKKL